MSNKFVRCLVGAGWRGGGSGGDWSEVAPRNGETTHAEVEKRTCPRGYEEEEEEEEDNEVEEVVVRD